MSDLTPERPEESLESVEATHDWIREFVGDHPYAHGLADDVFELRAALDAAEKERDEALSGLKHVGDVVTRLRGANKARRAAERERDIARNSCRFADAAWSEIAERLGARVAVLEKALEEILQLGYGMRIKTQAIARKALGEEESGELEPLESGWWAVKDEPGVVPTAPLCRYCGSLAWTVAKYGRVTHKQSCRYRTDPWHQSDPQVRHQEDDGA